MASQDGFSQVLRYTDPGLYERFTYPPKGSGEYKKLRSLVSDVWKDLDKALKGREHVNVLEVGPGTGVLTLELLQHMLGSSGSRPRKVSYTGVEASESMLRELRVRFKDQFGGHPGLSLHGVEAAARIEEWLKPKPSPSFDVILMFLFLHAPTRDVETVWKDPIPASGESAEGGKPEGFRWPPHNVVDTFNVIDSLLGVLDKDGVIVTSLLAGDHALWSCEFDGPDHSVEPANVPPERELLMKALVIVQDYLFHHGVSNRKALSASDATLAERCLQLRGMECTGHEREWSLSFGWREFLEVVAPMQDPPAVPFSVLPRLADPQALRDALAPLLSELGSVNDNPQLESHDRMSVKLFGRANER
jgi:SAM-dependent methyltransferase